MSEREGGLSSNFSAQDDHDEERLASDVDPAQALSRLKQAEADWKITNQVVTPFDTGKLIQSLNLPIGEILTVKLVTENVKPYRADTQNLESPIMPCLKCLEQNVKSELVPSIQKKKTDKLDKKLNCDNAKNCLTGNEHLDYYTDGAYFSCPKCELDGKAFDICAACVTRHFVRESLRSKTSMHSYFKGYDFVNEAQEDNVY